MRSLPSRSKLFLVGLFLVFSFATLPAKAVDRYLSNNIGGEDAVFFIKDEPSLVINGFDLTPLQMELPTALTAVSISVDQPAPGSSIDLVVYQDANGGSPVDATLVYRQSVSLGLAGLNRVELERAAVITEPVVWVGFYLPVDFRFHADRSGASVLTYWAWTPGGTFDVSSLANAAVLGPGDGSEPVEIEMDGIARITAETRSPNYDELAVAFPITEQMQTTVGQDASSMREYEDCPGVLYDPEDNSIGHALTFPMMCRLHDPIESPAKIYNPPDQLLNVRRQGQLYKLSTFLREEQLTPGRTSQLPNRVTHCLRVPQEDLAQAVIGEVREDPLAGERWYILPTVRVNELICAEVSTAHYLSYFLGRPDDAPPNINLVVGHSAVTPHPLTCGLEARFIAAVANVGRSWFKTDSGHVKVSVEDYDVITGVQTARYVFQINTDQLGPGARRELELGPVFVQSHAGTKEKQRRHRIEIRIDEDNTVIETNEDDNVWATEYVIVPYDGPYQLKGVENCADHKKVEKAARDAYNLGRAKVEFAKWSKACRRLPAGSFLVHLDGEKRVVPKPDQVQQGRCYKLEGGSYFLEVVVSEDNEYLKKLCEDTSRVCHRSTDTNTSHQNRVWRFVITRP